MATAGDEDETFGLTEVGQQLRSATTPGCGGIRLHARTARHAAAACGTAPHCCGIHQLQSTGPKHSPCPHSNPSRPSARVLQMPVDSPGRLAARSGSSRRRCSQSLICGGG